MIGGCIIQGSEPLAVVVRARGPSLTALGVPGALADLTLRLFSGHTVIASNDNWQTASNASTIQSSGFAPADPNEAAILITLQPGAYTAIVSGAGGDQQPGTAILNNKRALSKRHSMAFHEVLKAVFFKYQSNISSAAVRIQDRHGRHHRAFLTDGGLQPGLGRAPVVSVVDPPLAGCDPERLLCTL